MNFSLKLLESDSQIKSLILAEIKRVIENSISKSIPKITNEIKTAVSLALKSEPEYQSLISGQLKAEFGIPDSGQVDSIVDLMVNTLDFRQVPIKAGTFGLSGGFELTMLESSNLGGVISSAPAYVTDTKGYSLPWLEWLCLKNNEIIVRNFEVQYGPSPRSRSGMAIMVPSDDSWRVPPVFAGSKEKNWTTRAIERAEPQVYRIIQKNIEANI
jgi:hypothetical protein